MSDKPLNAIGFDSDRGLGKHDFIANRPPFETFKNSTCKGSYAFGSACGSCEKCAWERARMGLTQPSLSETIATLLPQSHINALRSFIERLRRTRSIPMPQEFAHAAESLQELEKAVKVNVPAK